MKAGIYTITAPSGGQYVGSAVNIAARWRRHRHELTQNKHFNSGLQRAFKKYGMGGLSFARLLICDRDNLLMYEQRAIDILKPKYNRLRVAGSRIGHVHTDSAKAKISAALTGCSHRDSFAASLTPAGSRQIAEEYIAGASIPFLRAKYHTTQAVIRAVILSQGLAIRPTGVNARPQCRKLSEDEIARRTTSRKANAERKRGGG